MIKNEVMFLVQANLHINSHELISETYEDILGPTNQVLGSFDSETATQDYEINSYIIMNIKKL